MEMRALWSEAVFEKDFPALGVKFFFGTKINVQNRLFHFRPIKRPFFEALTADTEKRDFKLNYIICYYCTSNIY